MEQLELMELLTAKPEKSLLDEAGLAALFKVSPRTISRWTQQSELPAPARIGNRKFWMAGRIVAFLEAKIAAAETSEARRISATNRAQVP